jgi:D-amino peptidase
MRILISADIEGTAGIVHDNQVTPPDRAGTSSPDYEWARNLMVGEVNAAVDGAFAGGATDVVVNDAHDGMRNLVPEKLDPRVRLITGNIKPLSMLQGIELGADAIICTGWHAARNTVGAVLSHTYSSPVRELSLNGQVMGELGLCAALAGHFAVPVVMVTGDDKLQAEARQLLGQQIVSVVVKEGISETSAIHVHPSAARKMIQEGARRAMGLLDTMKPLILKAPIGLELEFPTSTRADLAAQMPGSQRVASTRVSYKASDMLEIFNAFAVLVKLASGDV